MAARIVSILLGVVAAFASYPWWNGWLVAPLAVVAAVATGVVVYYLCLELLAGVLGGPTRRV